MSDNGKLTDLRNSMRVPWGRPRDREEKRRVVVVLYHGKDVEVGNRRVMLKFHA